MQARFPAGQGGHQCKGRRPHRLCQRRGGGYPRGQAHRRGGLRQAAAVRPLGREADFVIPWKDIVLIGEDTVLVQYEAPAQAQRQSALGRLLEKIGF